MRDNIIAGLHDKDRPQVFPFLMLDFSDPSALLYYYDDVTRDSVIPSSILIMSLTAATGATNVVLLVLRNSKHGVIRYQLSSSSLTSTNSALALALLSRDLSSLRASIDLLLSA